MLRVSRLDMAVWSTIKAEQKQTMYTTQDRTKRWTSTEPSGSLDSGQEVDLVRQKLLPQSRIVIVITVIIIENTTTMI